METLAACVQNVMKVIHAEWHRSHPEVTSEVYGEFEEVVVELCKRTFFRPEYTPNQPALHGNWSC